MFNTLLMFLNNYVNNYGVVLILFAFLIRIITGPLTKRAAISSQKMQKVQPLLKKIQKKYSGNPQKLNSETIALYRDNGVNPLGGCLPVVIQMPLLFSLFLVLYIYIISRSVFNVSSSYDVIFVCSHIFETFSLFYFLFYYFILYVFFSLIAYWHHVIAFRFR